ncbi:MAG: DUF4145 domain-containing protein [Paracoccaceae bacterium]
MKKDSLPLVIDDAKLEELKLDDIEDAEQREDMKRWAKKKATGRPFLGGKSHCRGADVFNVWISRCYNCNELALWIVGQMVFPQRGEAPPANQDLPPEIARDYDEASSILDLSPRGSAALIRLAIQKLCKFLDQPGDNINADIKALVAGGLDPRVQKALDAVRVVGNNAVHPGQMDIQDDRATAESLFKLLNLIVEKMISEPKHVDEVYDALPASARKAIEKRDGKADS